MGRNKKYTTDEEKKKARKAWSRDYYLRNKEKLDKYAKENYKSKKDV